MYNSSYEGAFIIESGWFFCAIIVEKGRLNMICPMQEEDIGRLEKIWHKESVRVHNWMDDPDKFWDDRREGFKKTINENGTNLVYREDDIIKGFVIKREDGYIHEIFVEEKHRTYPDGRSRKIGPALMEELKKSNSHLTASVYMLNHNAVKFYIKNDFVIIRVYVEKETGFAKFLVEWTKKY